MSPSDEAGTGNGSAGYAKFLKIGHVASILGVSTSRIRLWEHEGLIVPTRTDGGQRLYSPRDVERLEKIRDLLETRAMTFRGVRAALEEEPSPDAPPSTPDEMEPAQGNDSVGMRAKEMRLRLHLSLRDVASLSGISPSALSAFERGFSKPNTGRISKIAHALGTTVPELLGIPRPAEQTLVRCQDRERMPLNDEGVTIELLYKTSTVLQSQSIVVQPGCGIDEAMTHAGEDFLVVISGEIDIILDTIEIMHLGEGDSMTFASTRPHSFHNRGDVPAHMIWVNTPATF